MSDGGYGTASRTMYWRMYAGHNCTNYAAYRMVRSGLANTRPWTGSGNATNWGSAMSRITNGTPAVGAVAWWRAGVKPAGSAGHVAYVERVVSASEIIVSMDSWHGDFSWARVTRTSGGWPSGFVHFNDVRLRNTVAPRVTGTAKVGSTLTVSPGTWTPTPTTLSYQWLAGGAAIAGATKTTFVPTSAQIGKALTVRVSVSGLGYPAATAISAATTVVQPGVLTPTSLPRIDGAATVGETLTATPPTWTPSPDHVVYQWLADDAVLPGATSATLAVGPALAGKALVVKVTASKSGYPAVTAASAATARVALGSLEVVSTPRVDGTARPGGVLTVVLPSVRPASAVSIQWLRNGVPVPGATGRSYRLGSADLGARLLAQLRLTRVGYTPLTVRSTSTALVRATGALHLSTSTARRRLVLQGTVTAPGVRLLNGVLQVRSRGGLLRKVTIHNGVVRASLAKIPPGTRTYRFRVLGSTTFTTVMLSRRLTIRG
jgi:surface antigen